MKRSGDFKMSHTAKNSQNVASLLMQREIHSCQRGNLSRDLLAAAEDKAASCEMDELSCKVPENTRSTFLFTFSPDGTKVASAHGNHKIYICDVGTGKCLHTLEGHPRTPWCITFHPNYEGVLASGCLGGEVRVWDLHGGCEVWVGMINSAICSLSFHPFDRVLVIATTNTIYFWDWSQSQPFASCKTSCDREKVRFVQFDNYGHRIFTGIANVAPIFKQREFTSSAAVDQDPERLIPMVIDVPPLRARNQRLFSSSFMEETTGNGAEAPSLSPSFSHNLRLAREYAASQTANSAEEHMARHINELPQNSVPQTYERLLDRVLGLRCIITNLCDQIQTVTLPRDSESYMANCMWRFWREIASILRSVGQLLPSSGIETQLSFVETRNRLRDLVLQVQASSRNASGSSESTSNRTVQRHLRLHYIYTALSRMLDLIFLEFTMVIRRINHYEEGGHGVGGIYFHSVDDSIMAHALNELRLTAMQHGRMISRNLSGRLDDQNPVTRIFNGDGTASDNSEEIPARIRFRFGSLQLLEESYQNEINAEQILEHVTATVFTAIYSSIGDRPESSGASNSAPSSGSTNNSTSQPSSSTTPFNSDLHQQLRATIFNQRAVSYSGIRQYVNSEPIYVPRANYRIQCWDFSRVEIPDISNASANVVVNECLIQNDASIEISADGQLLATLIPSNSHSSNILAIYSIRSATFGQCLYMWNFLYSVISISLSPLGRYVLVGLGSKRRSVDNSGGKLVIGQVLKLIDGSDETRECVQHVRTVELRGENRFDVSLNSMRWLPFPGHGLVYGTNRGDLRICRPKSFNESGIRPPSTSQWLGHDLARDLPLQSRIRRLQNTVSETNSYLNASTSTPSTSSTGTQTESVHNPA